LGRAVCRDNDHEKPEQVLENPTEDEFRSRNREDRAKSFVVDVEEHHHAQGDERQG